MKADKIKDFVNSPNISRFPKVYELENESILRHGELDRSLIEIENWDGKVLLDIGCGNGFWLPQYAKRSTKVIGVEPDKNLLEDAKKRVSAFTNIQLEYGSAENLPLEDNSVDIAHARWAYFFGKGGEKGLDEVRRVLRPGGVFIAIDNSWEEGDFAKILRDSIGGNASFDPQITNQWWTDQGAERVDIEGGWQAKSVEELESILSIEFPQEVVQRFMKNHRSSFLSYAIALFVLRM